MAAIFYSSSLLSTSLFRTSLPNGSRSAAVTFGPRPTFSQLQGPSSLVWHLGPRVRATCSDLGDPDSLRQLGSEDYTATIFLEGSSHGDSVAPSQSSSLSDKLEAASQLNESPSSLSLNEEVGDGRTGGYGGDGDSGGNGGFGGSGGGDREGSDGDPNDKPKNMSASQKLTLAYAILVGVGGVMGYAKSKSMKSLVSGGLSSLVLFYVSTQLPNNPVFASSLGLGVSALLLAVMGARFKKSGKVFPAGIVALVSLIMTGGYIHGIMRSSHA